MGVAESDWDHFGPSLTTENIESLEPFVDAPYGAYAVDMDQRVVFWNEAAEQILGYDADEVLGQRCSQILDGSLETNGSRGNPQCAAVSWARRGDIAPSYTTQVRTRNNRNKWVTVTHVLLPAEVRENGVVIHILYDITDQIEGKHLLEQLGRYIAEVSRLPAPTGVRPSESTDDEQHDLTPRELEVLRKLASGRGTKEIADQLVVSQATVRTHIQRLLNKLGVGSRLEAVTVAARRGII